MTHIFLCSTAHVPPKSREGLLALLPAERRLRAEKDLSTGVAYLLARYAIRTVDPGAASAVWEIAPGGKPHLSDDTVHFSLSHTDDLVAVAVSKTHPVGVDIERIRPMRAGFAARWLSEAEQRHVLNAPDGEAALLTLWTKKEAAAKRDGRGLAFRPQKIAVTDTESTVLTVNGVRYALSISPSCEIAPQWITIEDLLP